MRNETRASRMKSRLKALAGHVRMRLARAIILSCAVVLALAGMLVLRGAPGSAGGSDVMADGPATQVTANGVTLSLRISSGPYFLSELVAVEMTLANGSGTSYHVQGAARATVCDAALWMMLSGGTPGYTLPTRGFMSCPPITSELKPGDTWDVVEMLPLTSSGNVTLTAHVEFAVQAVSADGQAYQTTGAGPFAHGWPALHITVGTAIPAGRTISLHASNLATIHTVSISAPETAREHLYSIFVTTCRDGQGGAAHISLAWQPTGTMLTEPDCSGTDETWSYSVGAPGYAIASGKYPLAGG